MTVIVKVLKAPTQLTLPLAKVGVTVIVAIIGVGPVLVAVKEGIFPVPPATKPMLVPAEFVQVYVVFPPVLVVANDIAAVVAPLQ